MKFSRQKGEEDDVLGLAEEGLRLDTSTSLPFSCGSLKSGQLLSFF